MITCTGWHGTLSLRFRPAADRTLVDDRHDGPMRILKALYPEGGSTCHAVLVHPPGGMVGGDRIDIDVALEAGSHALLTTPGATRFYRSAGGLASQRLSVRAATATRLEWLPLETIAYSGCIAENRVRFELEPGAEMIGWDITALGLPASGQPFASGRFTQAIEWPGRWLERGTVHGADPLLDSALGWAGRRVLATLWFAAGSPLAPARREHLLETARAAAYGGPLAGANGATAPCDEVVVVRVLAQQVEPAMALLLETWRRWRLAAWELAACPPRVWRT